MTSKFSDDLRSAALFYHRNPRPGKLEIQPTKPLANQRDLALAYSPGVAAACNAIVADAAVTAELTSRANLVGVYKDTGAAPQFVQVLPSGIGPEGLTTIASRNLLVTANEVDLVEDKLARRGIINRAI